MGDRGHTGFRGSRGRGDGSRGDRGGRGGRGGGRGGAHHGAGGAGGEGGATERPKKENILDLAKYMDKPIKVNFTGGRESKFHILTSNVEFWCFGGEANVSVVV